MLQEWSSIFLRSNQGCEQASEHGLGQCAAIVTMPCLADVSVLLMSFLLIVSATFAAAPTLEQLEVMLDRAITMMGAFIGDGVPFTQGFEDNLLLLQQVPFLPIIQHIVFLRNPLMHDLIFSNRFTQPTSCRTPLTPPTGRRRICRTRRLCLGIRNLHYFTLRSSCRQRCSRLQVHARSRH